MQYSNRDTSKRKHSTHFQNNKERKVTDGVIEPFHTFLTASQALNYHCHHLYTFFRQWINTSNLDVLFLLVSVKSKHTKVLRQYNTNPDNNNSKMVIGYRLKYYLASTHTDWFTTCTIHSTDCPW